MVLEGPPSSAVYPRWVGGADALGGGGAGGVPVTSAPTWIGLEAGWILRMAYAQKSVWGMPQTPPTS